MTVWLWLLGAAFVVNLGATGVFVYASRRHLEAMRAWWDRAMGAVKDGHGVEFVQEHGLVRHDPDVARWRTAGTWCTRVGVAGAVLMVLFSLAAHIWR